MVGEVRKNYVWILLIPSPTGTELSLAVRFGVSKMHDCHTHEVQEKGEGIILGLD